MARRHTLSTTLLVLAAAGSDSVSMVQQSAKRSEPRAPNAVASFRTGELVEALDTETGSWVPSHVLSGGSKPGSFSLAIPDVGVVPDVTAVALRRATRMRTGDLVEVHDLKSGEWYPATILGDGKQASYNVHVPVAGNLDDVPAVAVRRATRLNRGEAAEVMDQKTGLWAPCTIDSDGERPGTYNLDLHTAGRAENIDALVVRKAYPLKAGDAVEVLSNETHDWFQANVVSNGTKLDTLLLVVSDYGYLYDVPAIAVHKAAKHGDTAIGYKVEAGERVEFMDQITGSWVPATATKNGTRKDTYVLEAPILGTMFDVSVAALRKPDKLEEGEAAEALDLKSGVWAFCTIVGDGRETDSKDITIPSMGFYPDVPLTRVRHAFYPQPGEVMQVIDPKHNTWNTCRVLGDGSKPETFNLSIPGVGRLTDVTIHALRRVARPKV